MIKYWFKEDEPLTIKSADKANPQKIGEALTAISVTHGGHLVPAAVVDAARDTKSILHRHFEWNDKAAAEKEAEKAELEESRFKSETIRAVIYVCICFGGRP